MSQSQLTYKGKSLRFGLKCLSFLPRSLGWWVAGVSARWMQLSGSRSARVTDENLALCMPALSADERHKLTRDSLQHTAYMAFELAKVWTWDWPRLQTLLQHEIQGEPVLKQALADDRGLVILAPHIGNWELLGIYLQSLAPITILYQPVLAQSVNELVLDCRQRHGSTLLPTDKRGVMGLFKSLKAGGFTGILPDQVPDQGGAFAPFYDIPAYTMTLVHNLIQRTGCQVLMGACLRDGDKLRLTFSEPDAAIYSDQEAESLAALNHSVESVVAMAPAQYQWEYKRFRRRQHPDEPRRYQFKRR
ncbi:lysophospholipid acyltransferase family protein [Simiduia agarivorans]|uniref:Lipid A biosynthesis lauroyl acyltransferase n=1 Tax=Simiduia agarivorans (strain DSM 21679 / JCM 13881 / BCRC 17597 / SA1) TaxID=1117647 RepID=K4KKF4_SIMAS|nr:lysophospholipid acyltransferase family protein [Simiduia agarivorans]AFU99639.1 lipid A biosynthesis lauroyl acyltransferase [Simiduia agarivorans SA1 = DSM 21679]